MTMDPGKRRLLKALGAGGAVGLGLKTGVIPATWVKPVIDSVVSSAHAQVTPSPSPTAMTMAEPVPAASTGLVAIAAGALGYLGFKSLKGAKKVSREKQ